MAAVADGHDVALEEVAQLLQSVDAHALPPPPPPLPLVRPALAMAPGVKKLVTAPPPRKPPSPVAIEWLPLTTLTPGYDKNGTRVGEGSSLCATLHDTHATQYLVTHRTSRLIRRGTRIGSGPAVRAPPPRRRAALRPAPAGSGG